MKRCVFCHRRIWPWTRIGWLGGFGSWHPSCLETAVRDAYPSYYVGDGDPRRLTLEEIQRVLDDAQS